MYSSTGTVFGEECFRADDGNDCFPLAVALVYGIMEKIGSLGTAAWTGTCVPTRLYCLKY